jgi:hypothetical protein
MKIREWFTPLRTIALALVLVGGGLQLYALTVEGSSSFGHAGSGLLVIGLVIELLGYSLGNDKP